MQLRHRCPVWVLLSVPGALLPVSAPAQNGLRLHETRYYALYTDLDQAGTREAVLRITLMFEEYARRTEGLGGVVKGRLPFYLFKERVDYEAAGGKPGSSGVFTGDKLMAVADPACPDATWHAVQHEGFHQFVYATIGTGIPIWANEGLAEYFGLGLFTGDQFIVGWIPPARLARLKAEISKGQLKPLREMMLLSAEAWADGLAVENYDQAWSMVYFLAHAEGGRYQRAFTDFLRDVSRMTDWEEAWLKNLGSGVNAFQKRWQEYWTRLPDDPTADLYAEATVATLTGFLARAFSQRQHFDDIEEFLEIARSGKLKAHAKDWLPPSLLERALQVAPATGTWSLERRAGRCLLVCQAGTGTVFEGSFRVDAGRVKSVTVKVRAAKR